MSPRRRRKRERGRKLFREPGERNRHSDLGISESTKGDEFKEIHTEIWDVLQLSKVEDKERILKEVREMQLVYAQGNPSRTMSKFFSRKLAG